MIVIHRLERSLVWDRDGDAPVSVTSPHVPNKGKFPNQIESDNPAALDSEFSVLFSPISESDSRSPTDLLSPTSSRVGPSPSCHERARESVIASE